jgi:hypothetical protein
LLGEILHREQHIPWTKRLQGSQGDLRIHPDYQQKKKDHPGD